MKFKILGGKIKTPSAFHKDKHADGRPTSKAIILMFGNLLHEYQSTWGNLNSFHIGVDLESCEIVTDENKVNFTGALGWGAVGGVLTGGIGLLAGALLGGRGKQTVCAVRFSDGTQFLVSGKTKDCAKLMFEV